MQFVNITNRTLTQECIYGGRRSMECVSIHKNTLLIPIHREILIGNRDILFSRQWTPGKCVQIRRQRFTESYRWWVNTINQLTLYLKRVCSSYNGSFIFCNSPISYTDLIDIVKEPLYGNDYSEGEDPSKYVSAKTNRGPLAESWLEDYWHEVSFLGFIRAVSLYLLLRTPFLSFSWTN